MVSYDDLFLLILVIAASIPTRDKNKNLKNQANKKPHIFMHGFSFLPNGKNNQ
jgi:hypothetical protein